MNWLQYDSGFMKVMDKISKIAIVNILFLFTCIPVFTIGMALEGMYGSLIKWIWEKDDRVFHNYIQSIREGWGKAEIGFGILVGIAGVLVMEIKIAGSMPVAGKYICTWIACVTGICVFITGLYYFPLVTMGKRKVYELITISFAGGVKCLLYTLLLTLLLGIEIFAFTLTVKLLPIWITVGFAGFGYIQAQIYLWVFEKIGVVKRNREGEKE